MKNNWLLNYIRFADGLAPVLLDGQFGFIDHSGQVVAKIPYNQIGGFSEGLLAIKVKNKWGYINKYFEITIEPKYDEAGTFSEGLAHVQIDNGVGYIDKKGFFVIQPQYDAASGFSEGLAIAGNYPNDDAFIDTKGNVVLKFSDDLTCIASFSCGLAQIGIRDKFYRYIDKNGKIIIEQKYEDANSFSDGLAAIKMNGKWGFINTLGEIVIEPQYEDCRNFNENLALVYINSKTVFIDKQGKIVIDISGSGFGNFSEGLATILVDDKYGFIDKTGAIVIKPQFNLDFYLTEGMGFWNISVNDPHKLEYERVMARIREKKRLKFQI